MNTGQTPNDNDLDFAELSGMCARALAAAGLEAMANPHDEGSKLWRRWNLGHVTFQPNVSREKNPRPGRGGSKMGLRREWSPTEVMVLRTYHGLETSAQIGARIGRNSQSVRSKAHRMREELAAIKHQDKPL